MENWKIYRKLFDDKKLHQKQIMFTSGVSQKTLSDYLNGRHVSSKYATKIEKAIDGESKVVEARKDLSRREINLELLKNIFSNLPDKGQDSLLAIAREIEIIFRQRF